MANTLTSHTGTAAGTSPNFTVTYLTSALSEVIALMKYVKGTNNLTATFDIINPSIHATDRYRITVMAADATTAAMSVALTGTGNYRIPLEKLPGDSIIVGGFTYAGTGGTSTCEVNFVEG